MFEITLRVPILKPLISHPKTAADSDRCPLFTAVQSDVAQYNRLKAEKVITTKQTEADLFVQPATVHPHFLGPT